MASLTRKVLQTFYQHHSHKGLTSAWWRHLHTSKSRTRDEATYNTGKQLQKKSSQYFDDLAQKKEANKRSFEMAVDVYLAKEDVYRRGHIEFIYSALERLKLFKSADDLDVYKKLLEVFPKEKMIPRSAWQVEFMHFPRQQQCAIDIMEEMENNGVIPDHEFGSILKARFGPNAHVFRKYRRMMYWMPKFKNANPYPVPRYLPDDPSLLAVLALKRMSVDTENFIDVWKTSQVETDALEDTFIASAQSPAQRDLIAQRTLDTPLFVEGGYTVWLRDKSQVYFVLRDDPSPERMAPKVDKEEEDLFEWKVYDTEERTDIVPAWGIHEQDDGTILGMAITGTGSKDSLVTWIRYLQRTNPRLEHIPVVFSLRTPQSEVQLLDKDGKEVVQTKS